MAGEECKGSPLAVPLRSTARGLYEKITIFMNQIVLPMSLELCVNCVLCTLKEIKIKIMGYDCYQIIRIESKHHDDFSKFEKRRFYSFNYQEKIVFYLNDQGKEIAEILLGRRSLECPIEDISEETDWEELDLMYNIWVMGFGKNRNEEYSYGWRYEYGLYFYENGKFNYFGRPIYEFDRIRLYVNKHAFNSSIKKNEIVKFQDHITITIESDMVLDFVKKGEYSFGWPPFNLFDYTKIDSLYQVYGKEVMIVNPDAMPIDMRNEIIKKLFLNHDNVDEICSRFWDLIFKIEIFHNNNVVFLSLPQRELYDTVRDIQCQDFSIMRWSNLINDEWLKYNEM